jgi:hypothetical protein
MARLDGLDRPFCDPRSIVRSCVIRCTKKALGGRQNITIHAMIGGPDFALPGLGTGSNYGRPPQHAITWVWIYRLGHYRGRAVRCQLTVGSPKSLNSMNRIDR